MHTQGKHVYFLLFEEKKTSASFVLECSNYVHQIVIHFKADTIVSDVIHYINLGTNTVI